MFFNYEIANWLTPYVTEKKYGIFWDFSIKTNSRRNKKTKKIKIKIMKIVIG